MTSFNLKEPTCTCCDSEDGFIKTLCTVILNLYSNNNNNNNTLIYIAPACRMTSEALEMTSEALDHDDDDES